MGKKARIRRYPQKYGRKYSGHPILSSASKEQPAQVAPVEPIAEEVVEPAPAPEPVVESVEEPAKPAAKKRAVKKAKAKK